MSIRDEIAKQAMTLSPEDRAYVADLLEGSLPSGEFSNPEIAAAWSREIDRRVEAYDRGETTGIDFDDALHQMRKALRPHGDDKVGQ
jgi:putative addiction module component (TIGR02574 family)